jgi:hypothetical protein
MNAFVLGTLTLATLCLGGGFAAVVTARLVRQRRDSEDASALGRAVEEVERQLANLAAAEDASTAAAVVQRLERLEARLSELTRSVLVPSAVAAPAVAQAPAAAPGTASDALAGPYTSDESAAPAVDELAPEATDDVAAPASDGGDDHELAALLAQFDDGFSFAKASRKDPAAGSGTEPAEPRTTAPRQASDADLAPARGDDGSDLLASEPVVDHAPEPAAEHAGPDGTDGLPSSTDGADDGLEHDETPLAVQATEPATARAADVAPAEARAEPHDGEAVSAEEPVAEFDAELEDEVTAEIEALLAGDSVSVAPVPSAVLHGADRLAASDDAHALEASQDEETRVEAPRGAAADLGVGTERVLRSALADPELSELLAAFEPDASDASDASDDAVDAVDAVDEAIAGAEAEAASRTADVGGTLDASVAPSTDTLLAEFGHAEEPEHDTHAHVLDAAAADVAAAVGTPRPSSSGTALAEHAADVLARPPTHVAADAVDARDPQARQRVFDAAPAATDLRRSIDSVAQLTAALSAKGLDRESRVRILAQLESALARFRH